MGTPVTREEHRQRLLGRIKAANGLWVGDRTLAQNASPEVAALVHELIGYGQRIESRQNPTDPSEWQYRLVVPVTDASGSKLAANDDPWTSKLAAELVWPRVDTRQDEVLERLLIAKGQWVPGHELCTPACGGSEGLKRVRELRTELGWNVEREPQPSGRGTWLYRIPVESVP